MQAELSRAKPQMTWIDPEEFMLEGLKFRCCVGDFTKQTTPEHVVLLKPKSFVERYNEVMKRLDAKRVLEFGIFEGGSALFLAIAGTLDLLVAIDLRKSPAGLMKILDQHPVKDHISLHFGVSQDDKASVREIVDRKFGHQPLDMVTDDASHFYAQTRAGFEASFGYLRPGGIYVIEDWGWAHWPGEWQGAQHPWRGQPAMSNFIFELVMLQASISGMIAKIEIIDGAMAFITRGHSLKHGEPLDLSKLINARGRPLPQI